MLTSNLRQTQKKIVKMIAIKNIYGRILQSAKFRIRNLTNKSLKIFTRLEVEKVERVAEQDEDVLKRAESIIQRAIEVGRAGRLKVVPEMISISATENCNLKCVMCPGHSGMKGPILSIEDADTLFSSLADKNIDFGSPKLLDMTSGEPTINPDLGPIYRRFKTLFPKAKISMISNATIPVRGRIREAFELTDRVGLSMDGATQETYERIRRGSVYKNVVRNVRDVAEMKQVNVNCENLELMFVAMDQNIHELPEMVRLAHSLGVPGVFAQVSEVRKKTPFNIAGQNITLGLSDEELAPYVIEAQAEAKRLGITLSLTSRFLQAVAPKNEVSETHSSQKATGPAFNVAIKTCSVPWLHSPRFHQDEDGLYPNIVCCHMPNTHRTNITNRLKEFKGKTLYEIYNSDFYWDMREGLLDGSLAKGGCAGCQYLNMTQWTAPQLLELEAATKKVARTVEIVSSSI